MWKDGGYALSRACRVDLQAMITGRETGTPHVMVD